MQMEIVDRRPPRVRLVGFCWSKTWTCKRIWCQRSQIQVQVILLKVQVNVQVQQKWTRVWSRVQVRTRSSILQAWNALALWAIHLLSSYCRKHFHWIQSLVHHQSITVSFWPCDTYQTVMIMSGFFSSSSSSSSSSYLFHGYQKGKFPLNWLP